MPETIDPKTAEKVWSMHCLRKTVACIAEKTGLSEETVRRIIRVYWKSMD